MSTIVEQFESVLFARAAQIDSSDPHGYAAGYLLSLVKGIVEENPTIENTLRKHINSLEYTVAGNTDNNDDEIVYFY